MKVVLSNLDVSA